MVAMAAAVCIVAGSPAQAARKNSGVVDASKQVAGFTAGQLLGEEWRQLLELPPDANPLAGTGDNCLSAGHKDKVRILWTTGAPTPPAVCNVKPGTPVFFCPRARGRRLPLAVLHPGVASHRRGPDRPARASPSRTSVSS
jgi:hypothetical protein